uniref:Putative secreted protein n=1 Tax=Ixodes ricinus TaxID=34613 RepID=A0A6B0UQF8_IXORI
MPLAVLGTLSTGSIRVSHAQRVEFVGISRVRDIWLALHLRWRESVPHVNHRRVIANLDNAGWDCVNNVRHNLMGLHLRLCGAALKAHAARTKKTPTRHRQCSNKGHAAGALSRERNRKQRDTFNFVRD